MWFLEQTSSSSASDFEYGYDHQSMMAKIVALFLDQFVTTSIFQVLWFQINFSMANN